MNIQSLKHTKKFINNYIKQNRKAKLKTIFKKLRGWDSLSIIGDWPLISEIVCQSAKFNKFYTPKEVVETYKLTNDPYLRRLRSNSKLVLFLTNKDELKSLVSA